MEGNRVGYEYNGATYWYVTNIQGDVMYVADSSGTPIGKYDYSHWGDVTATLLVDSASAAFAANPFTYRGYYYDEEVGLYYLQSRYYDAEVGRFINSDGYAATGQGFTGNNMYAYCLNSPLLYCDDTGTRATMRQELGATGGSISIQTTLFSLGVISSLVETVTETWDDVKDKISKSIVKSNASSKTYKTTTEDHHIVAKGSYKAKEARKVLLATLGPDAIDSPQNLVSLKTAVHRRIHNNLYYAITNQLVVWAYESANGDEQKQTENVSSTLLLIKETLIGFNFLP